jgi:methylmalonyl-CoA/ethylmalonyl-CoA epimerase
MTAHPATGATALPSAPSDLSARFDLGPIDQISFAVEDIEAVLPFYTALFGEFVTREVQFSPEAVSYRGQPTSARLLLGFGRSGDIEIELVQVLEGDAPSLEHLAQHGPGLHHVRFRVPDVAAKVSELETAGLRTVLNGTTARGSVFAYVEAPDQYGHTVLELIQDAP